MKFYSLINKYIITACIGEIINFNINTYNIKVIRDETKQETKFLFTERLYYSLLALTVGPYYFPMTLFDKCRYLNILMIGEKPENYGYKKIPKIMLYKDVFHYI